MALVARQQLRRFANCDLLDGLPYWHGAYIAFVWTVWNAPEDVSQWMAGSPERRNYSIAMVDHLLRTVVTKSTLALVLEAAETVLGAQHYSTTSLKYVIEMDGDDYDTRDIHFLRRRALDAFLVIQSSYLSEPPFTFPHGYGPYFSVAIHLWRHKWWVEAEIFWRLIMITDSYLNGRPLAGLSAALWYQSQDDEAEMVDQLRTLLDKYLQYDSLPLSSEEFFLLYPSKRHRRLIPRTRQAAKRKFHRLFGEWRRTNLDHIEDIHTYSMIIPGCVCGPSWDGKVQSRAEIPMLIATHAVKRERCPVMTVV